MAEQYIIGSNAQFNDSVEILKDLTLYGVVENTTDFAVKIQGDEKLRITSDDLVIENDVVSFKTEGSERLRIATPSAKGIVSFIATDAQDVIHITTGNVSGDTFSNVRGDNQSGIRIRGGGSYGGGMIELAGGLRNTDPGIIKFHTGTDVTANNPERLRIASNGMLLKGHTASAGQIESQLNQQNQFHGNNRKGGIRIADFSNSQFPASLEFVKSRNATTGQNTILQDGDRMGSIYWGGANGTNYQPAAFITGKTDGTVSSTSMPGAITFGTNAGDSIIERIKIDPNGNLNIGVHDSSNPFTYLRFGASLHGAADIRPTNEASHKVGLAFYVDGTQDTTINPTEQLRITSSGNLQFNSGFGSVQTAYGVRAWALWNGETNTILDDGNIAGFTDQGTGTYTFTFDNNMPDGNYVITGSTGRNAKPHFSLSSNVRNADNFRISTGTWGSSYSAVDVDSAMFCVIC